MEKTVMNNDNFENVKLDIFEGPLDLLLNLIRENDSKWNGKRGSNWPSDFRISEEDSHPNTKGHKFIGEYLYEQCKHLYPDS